MPDSRVVYASDADFMEDWNWPRDSLESEVLERTFPRELLSSTTGCEYETTKGTINLLEEMEQSGDCVEKLVSDFFRLNDAEGVYDTDYIKATLQLVKGENVVFFNPFYRAP